MSEVRNMMLEDSKDLLDNVEVSTVAQECVKLKNKEWESYSRNLSQWERNTTLDC